MTETTSKKIRVSEAYSVFLLLIIIGLLLLALIVDDSVEMGFSLSLLMWITVLSSSIRLILIFTKKAKIPDMLISSSILICWGWLFAKGSDSDFLNVLNINLALVIFLDAIVFSILALLLISIVFNLQTNSKICSTRRIQLTVLSIFVSLVCINGLFQAKSDLKNNSDALITSAINFSEGQLSIDDLSFNSLLYAMMLIDSFPEEKRDEVLSKVTTILSNPIVPYMREVHPSAAVRFDVLQHLYSKYVNRYAYRVKGSDLVFDEQIKLAH